MEVTKIKSFPEANNDPREFIEDVVYAAEFTIARQPRPSLRTPYPPATTRTTSQTIPLPLLALTLTTLALKPPPKLQFHSPNLLMPLLKLFAMLKLPGQRWIGPISTSFEVT